ncbi:MAG TPA: ABC transporter ATP-binding protein [Mycobacteriales bacterium]|nr:ABC transporter ATP-binding protein [Mycobacteriales bacterium]
MTAPAALPAVELVGVGKEFTSNRDTVVAVDDVDMVIAQGEFFSMLGPSGCGKTTTLRMIAGFEQPSRGTVLLYGEDVTTVAPNHRDVNMVFQNYALFPHMSVADNVAFGLRRKHVEKAEVRRRVGEMLDLVELSGRERRRPRELSGGQQQRVALARALVNHPRALLLDEPLGALDLKLRQSMQIELKRIQREVGITFVYVTHDQGEALTMSDRIVVMNNARIEQLGTPRELYEQPSTPFVAGFIGTSNIMTGTVTSVSDGTAQLETGADERAIVGLRAPTRTGERLAATVRPEKMTLSATPSEHACRLRARLSEIVYLGTSTNYTVETILGQLVVYRLNAGEDLLTPQRGDQLWVGWPDTAAYQLVDSPQSERAETTEEMV